MRRGQGSAAPEGAFDAKDTALVELNVALDQKCPNISRPSQALPSHNCAASLQVGLRRGHAIACHLATLPKTALPPTQDICALAAKCD
jgi:hypothetical protein